MSRGKITKAKMVGSRNNESREICSSEKTVRKHSSPSLGLCELSGWATFHSRSADLTANSEELL